MREQKKECISMLLAGGQGSRLYVLTERTAKPAVPFGGKYRIIDFSLSNCVNSGIDTIGILTQYQPLELNEYIGTGDPWGLNRNFGGVHVLPPYTKSQGNEWYKGTANAIYQNFPFIEMYGPKYVLILSGDHIYKMDYAKMLSYHKEKGAECTIAVIEVPLSEASRMGIMSADAGGAITEFEEKPAVPKSNTASMGVYIFNWDVLRKYLTEDENDPKSDNDFGKNVIPKMLSEGRKMFAYRFEGYWKDVGTLDSLWKANMDLLDPDDPIRLRDPAFRIYSRNYAHPSSVLNEKAEVRHSYVAEGCVINGSVSGSIIYSGCTVEEGAVVENSVVMPGSVIKKGAAVRYAMIGEDCTVASGAVFGEKPEEPASPKIAVLGHGKTVAEGQTVAAGSIL